MLEKLLESLDKEVYTAEMLESIQTQFNEAVETRAEEIASEKVTKVLEEALAEKDKEMETKIAEVENTADSYVNEAIEKEIAELEEKTEEFVIKKIGELSESLDSFLGKVVEEFITETKSKLDESLKSAKADMIIESYEAMLTAGSLDLMKIAEAKDESSVEFKLRESIEKYDALMVENLELQKEKTKLIKTGIILEMKEGLSIVESKKFENLAEMVPFSQDGGFVKKLELIKESISGVRSEPEVTEPSKTETQDITESTQDKKIPSYSHLV